MSTDDFMAKIQRLSWRNATVDVGKDELQRRLDVALDGMAHYRREAEAGKRLIDMLTSELKRLRGDDCD